MKLWGITIDTWVQMVSTLFWGIYVFFTIKTFNEVEKQTKEIKKQTELSNNAHLVVKKDICQNIDDSTTNLIPSEIQDSYKKWEQIVKDNVKEVSNKDYIVLELKNRGGSDIVNWEMEIDVEIEPSDFLKNHSQTTGEDYKVKISPTASSLFIEKEESIKVAVGLLGSFPEVDMKFSFTYKDMREKNYTTFSGDKNITDTNPYAHITEEEFENRNNSFDDEFEDIDNFDVDF